MADTYYGKINQLVRFLTREEERGYTFAVALDQRMILAINNEIVQSSAGKALNPIRVSWLNKEKNLIDQLEEYLESHQGLLVMGLDSWVKDDQKLLYLNFSREDLFKLNKPLVFWITQDNLARLSNSAIDLFSQRRTTTVFFEPNADFEIAEPALEKRFHPKHFSEDERNESQLSLNLKKKQLKEAIEAKLSPSRVAIQYALPLIEAYYDLDLHDEAMELFYQYLTELDVNQLSIDHKFDLSRICDAGNDYIRAKQYLEAILIETDISEPDENVLSNRSAAFSNLGDLYSSLGELPRAQEFFEQDLILSRQLAERNPQSEQLQRDLAIAIAKLADLETTLGLLDSARERYEQSIELSQKLAERNPQSEQLQRDYGVACYKLALMYEKLVTI